MAPILSTPRPLTPGDVIIVTKPIIHVIYNQFKGQYCDNCLKCGQMKKCMNCRLMYYCDKNCQRIDWIHHKNECKVFADKSFKLNEVNWAERMLIRLWLIIQSDETFTTKRHKLFDGSDICLNDIEVKVEQLSEDIDDMIHFRLICNHFNDLKIKFNSEELLRCYGLITVSVIKCEILSYSSYKGGSPGLIPTIGLGLYPELGAISHSCLPNSIVVSNGLSLELRVIKPISIGTQIIRSYVYLAQNKSERHKFLKEKHLIIGCECDKCEQNLESNIDYQKLDKLFDKQTKELAGLIRPYDTELNVTKIVSEMSEISSLAEKVMGPFDPKLTEIFYTEIMYRQMFGFQNKGMAPDPYHGELIKKYKKHILITYGVNHPIYKHKGLLKSIKSMISK